MPMPKAAVNKNDLTFFRKNDIWFSGQILPVQPVPIAHGVEDSTYDHFRAGVNGSDGLHDFASLFCGAEVDH